MTQSSTTSSISKDNKPNIQQKILKSEDKAIVEEEEKVEDDGEGHFLANMIQMPQDVTAPDRQNASKREALL
jgi:hypothetical protein